jgi:hypothetical protein
MGSEGAFLIKEMRELILCLDRMEGYVGEGDFGLLTRDIVFNTNAIVIIDRGKKRYVKAHAEKFIRTKFLSCLSASLRKARKIVSETCTATDSEAMRQMLKHLEPLWIEGAMKGEFLMKEREENREIDRMVARGPAVAEERERLAQAAMLTAEEEGDKAVAGTGATAGSTTITTATATATATAATTTTTAGAAPSEGYRDSPDVVGGVDHGEGRGDGVELQQHPAIVTIATSSASSASAP